MSSDYDEVQKLQTKIATGAIFKWTFLTGVLATILIVAGLIGCPSYNVYKQKKEGEAVLAHAQSSREVAVAEAKANSGGNTNG